MANAGDIVTVAILTVVLFLASVVLWYLHKDESYVAAQARHMKGKEKIIKSF